MIRSFCIAALMGVAACASAGGAAPQLKGTPRPLATLPPSLRFVPDAAFHGSGKSLYADRCLTHLIDPGGSVRLTLVRSVGGDAKAAAEGVGVTSTRHPQGDFATAPQSPYGLRAGELLRVDCATGQALGAVKR
jgi:hypothetical protein